MSYVVSNLEALGSRVLVIAPHSDDEVLGCGGLISRYVDAKLGSVHIVCATVGDMKFRHGKEVTSQERKEEFLQSCDLLGVKSAFVWDHENDSRLDSRPKADFISVLDNINGNFKPTTVLLPYPSFHQDHQYVFDCGLAMCRPSPQQTMKLVMMYEYPASGWNYHPIQGGDCYVDITGYMERKVEALRAHKSQIRESPHLFSEDSMKVWATMRAREAGHGGYAELFKVLRWCL